MSDLLVTTVNNHGDSVTLRIAPDERGLSLVESLKRQVRREELQSVEVVETDDDAEVAKRVSPPTPTRRRGDDPVRTRGTDSPDPADEPAGDELPGGGEGDADLEALRAEYERMFETAPDGRWQAPRLRKELAKHQEG